MFKPSYIVVTSVLVVLAILACARQLLYGYLPPSASNSLEGSAQGFLSSAAHYPINWLVVDNNPFVIARHSDKPILLVIGTYGGRLTLDLDLALFADPDTAQYASENFLCVRIDGYEHPEWLNAILPFTRVRRNVYTGFQVWVLNADGYVISVIGNLSNPKQFDRQKLYWQLIQARRRFDDLKGAGLSYQASQNQQQVDLDLLGSQSGAAIPSFTGFTALLAGRCDYRDGGFPHGEIQRMYPNVWRFLTLTGNSRLLKSSLDPLLLSPIMDLQDGGFFQLGASVDVRRVELDKCSCVNSEMMLELAIQGQLDGDQFYQTIAQSTFDWLANEADENEFIPACQQDDENPQGRSPRLSFPSWKLRDVLKSEDQRWAADNLGLNPFRNAQMIPYLSSRNILLDLDSPFSHVMDALRSSTNLRPHFSDTGYLDVNGHSVARMLEVARIWGDQERMARATTILKGLDAFNSGGVLVHRADDPIRRRGYLGDYLAYADAKLQEYLDFEDIAAFQDGLRVLGEAAVLFQGDQPGQFNLGANSGEMGGFDTFCVPELGDDYCESCTAQAIRLLLAYGRLLSDTRAGQAYLELASSSIGLFANLAHMVGPTAAGYYCAAAEVTDDIYAVTVGPRAMDLANMLYHRIPTRFVAPAVGGLRRDLQHLGPGVYLVGKTVEGPFTVEQAAERLPATLVGRPIDDRR